MSQAPREGAIGEASATTVFRTGALAVKEETRLSDQAVEGERTEPCGCRGSSRGGSADAVPWPPGPQRPMLFPASHTESYTHGTMALCPAGWLGKQS